MHVSYLEFGGEGSYNAYFAEIQLNCFQAILSQFSKSKKSVSDDPDGDTDADAFAELEEDEEVDEEEIEAANEVDADREASDRAVIEEVAQDVDNELGLSLTDINLGCFALTKVRWMHANIFMFNTY
jgi:hypothetical protein